MIVVGLAMKTNGVVRVNIGGDGQKRRSLLGGSSMRAVAVFGLAVACQLTAGSGASALSLPGNLSSSDLSKAGSSRAPFGRPLLHRVQIVASDFMVVDAVGKPNEPLLLKIALPHNPDATYSFLMFRGLPPKFAMSSGFATKNHWAVSLNDLAGLRLLPPQGFSGSFNLEVVLVKGRDVAPETRTMRVELRAPELTPATVEDAAGQLLTSGGAANPADAPRKTATPVAREMNDEDRFMMERGDVLVKQGDVAAARLIYHRIAKKGVAVAALAMGRSYDPEFLRTLKVEGLQPDAAQARVWYRMAEELGSSLAKNRLETINGGN